jgi:CPA2 family monovalent cation:H+ antiporter-2
MLHHTPLITTVVAGLGLAFILGAIANRLKVSPLVGYLLAGVVIGPATPGFVADASLASELAEIGVILLMFGVGLHFSLRDLLSVRAIAIPGALGQIAIATLMGLGLTWALDWPLAAGLVFGLALSVASTVVLLRAMQERRLLETERGRIAVGWLIVEDLAMVLALVLLPAIAGILQQSEASDDVVTAITRGDVLETLAITFGKVTAFVALMLVVGRRVVPWVLHFIAHTGSRELFRLAVLAIALGVAYGAAVLFGVSFALGAFFAGMIMSESELSHRAAEESLPLRDAFAVLFFVSVGMLFDPMVLVEQPLPVLATFLIIVLGKSAAAYLIVRAFGHPRRTALLISASLAQIGEFSFILAGLGIELRMLPAEGHDLILAGAMLSILVNPLLFALLDRWRQRAAAEPSAPAEPDAAEVEPAAHDGLVPTRQSGHAVVVGCGRVGGRIAEALERAGLPFLVIDEVPGRLQPFRARQTETFAANAVHDDVLAAANIAGARSLFVAIPQAFEAGQIVLKARAANAALIIVARAHGEAEVDHLKAQGATAVTMGETEIARGMVETAFGLTGDPAPAAAT